MLAEREGFEPPDLSVNGFQDRRHKPLGHLSGRKSIPARGPSAVGIRPSVLVAVPVGGVYQPQNAAQFLKACYPKRMPFAQ